MMYRLPNLLEPVPSVEQNAAQLRFCDDLGWEIADLRWRTGVEDRNNLPRTTFADSVARWQRGMRGEGALYLFFGGRDGGATWDTSVGRRTSTAEITYRGHLYDAKSVGRNDHCLLIYPEGLKPHWRYVLVGCEDAPVFYLLGWCEGRDVVGRPLEARVAGRPAYWIEQGDPILRNCSELVAP